MELVSKKLKTDVMEKVQSSNQVTLDSLPIEMQETIFGYLTNPRDLINLCNTKKQFAAMLEPTKVKWSFCEVLKIMLEQDKQDPSFCWMDQCSYFNNLRLVCKSWRRSVNTVLESDSSHLSIDWNESLLLDQHILNAPSAATFKLYEDIKDDEQKRIQDFTTYFLEHKHANPPFYNPLPTRHLHIKFQPQLPLQLWEEYSLQITRYLEIFGKHIWYLTLGDGSIFENSDLATVYTYITEWVTFMPNVKSLVCDIRGGGKPTIQLLTPFPHLKDLTSGQFGEFCDTAYHILKTNKHVRKLAFMNNSILPKILKINFTNSLELSLPRVFVEEISSVQVISCMIHKLSVKYDGLIHSIKRFMMFFMKMKRNVLEHLELDLSDVAVFDPVQELLNFPNLTSIWISVPRRCVLDLDWFLGHLTSLQTISLEMEHINDVFLSSISSQNESLDEDDHHNFSVNEVSDIQGNLEFSTSSQGESMEELEEDSREQMSMSMMSAMNTGSDKPSFTQSLNGDSLTADKGDLSSESGIPNRKKPYWSMKEENEKFKATQITSPDVDLAYMDKFFYASLWDELPHLKTVNVMITCYHNRGKHYCYEMQRAAGKSELTFNFFPGRRSGQY